MKKPSIGKTYSVIRKFTINGMERTYWAQIVIFPEHTVPNGFLAKDHAAQACWMMYINAYKSYRTVGQVKEDQKVLEGDPWHYKHYAKQLKAVAHWYDVTPEEITKHWPAVRLQCKARGLPAPLDEFMNIQDNYKNKG